MIGSLYVSQAIPLGFFIVALPAILRSRGASLEQVSLLSAVALPWLLKFLWAPVVDGYGSRSHGHFRSWILPLQAASAATVVIIAAIGTGSIAALATAGSIFMLLAATQDVATDGLAVRALRHAHRGPGNAIQVGGYYLGHILGGGVMLVAFHRLGWIWALLLMASFLALPLIPVAWYREPDGPHLTRNARLGAGAGYRALGRFFRRPGAGRWVAVLLLYRSAETMALTMFNPMLVDLGYSLESIGLLLGVATAAASLTGAAIGGLLLRGQTARKIPLVAFLLAQSIALAGLVLPASGATSIPVVYGAALAVALTGGMATTALYTAMMDASETHFAATDYSLQQALCAAGPLVMASMSGFSASAFGYRGHFILASLLAAGVAVLVSATSIPARTKTTAQLDTSQPAQSQA